jgi:hypothetical protein
MSNECKSLKSRFLIFSPSFINSLEIDWTSLTKSPFTPLFQKGIIPPFVKGRRRRPEPYYLRRTKNWDFGAGRLGGFYDQCSHYYETLNKWRWTTPTAHWNKG